MEISWSTLFFEILNFLILVWILKRFLYQPVLNAISRRQSTIEEKLADAEEKHSEAESIREQYENRLAEWGEEKRAARETLRDEIAQERERLTASLEKSIEEEREKKRVLEERRLEDLRHKDQQTALENSLRFVTHLLERLGGPELEAQLVDMALKDLPTLLPERIDELRNAYAELKEPIRVVSAYPLSTDQRTRIQQALGGLLQTDRLTCNFDEDGKLMAGLRISLGPWILRANLQDELRFFSGSVDAAQ